MLEYYIATVSPDCYITINTSNNHSDCKITHFVVKPPPGILYIYKIDRKSFLGFVKGGHYKKINEEELALML